MRSDLSGRVELGRIAGEEVAETERQGLETAGGLTGRHPRCGGVVLGSKAVCESELTVLPFVDPSLSPRCRPMLESNNFVKEEGRSDRAFSR